MRNINVFILYLATALVMQTGYAQTHAALDTVAVQTLDTPSWLAIDGVVQAVRESTLAAQVPGQIIMLSVRAGDHVQAGQTLLQIDAHTADQDVLASQARTSAAQATLDLAARDLERQRALYEAKYLSRSAFERAQAQYRTALAQVQAQEAKTRASQAQNRYFTVHAPYAGTIASVPANLGDMAMPGQALITLYDPAVLRVSASVPQSILGRLSPQQALWLELPGIPSLAQRIIPIDTQILPKIDPATHTGHIRLSLPHDLTGVDPGAFARVWLPNSTQTGPRLLVPARALIRHTEFIGLYILTPEGRPLLRQVRLGPQTDDLVEVLSGVAAGEQVALDPQAAAQWH